MANELSPARITSLMLFIARDLLGFEIQAKYYDEADETPYILSTKGLATYIRKPSLNSHEGGVATGKELGVIRDLLTRSIRMETLIEKGERFPGEVETLFIQAASLIGYKLRVIRKKLMQKKFITNISIVGGRILYVHGLAKASLKEYLTKKPDGTLTQEHKIYIEDHLRRQFMDALYLGKTREIKMRQIEKAINESRQLSPGKLQSLQRYGNETTPAKFFEHLTLIDDLVWKTLEIKSDVRDNRVSRNIVRELFVKYLKIAGFKFDKSEQRELNTILDIAQKIHERTSSIGSGYFESEPSRLYPFFHIDEKVKQEISKKSHHHRLGNGFRKLFKSS